MHSSRHSGMPHAGMRSINRTGSQHPPALTHLSNASARALAEPAKRMPTARQAPATQQQWACGQLERKQ